MLDEILRAAATARASDVHLNAGAPPLFRIDTVLRPSELNGLSAATLNQLARQIMGEKRWTDFQTSRDVDFSYELPSLGRFRINAHYQRQTVALSIRLIEGKIQTLEALGLPEIATKLTMLTQGLVLVTGPAGCGKSTTLAAMIDTINRRDNGHIITLEDPIEYAMTSKKCAIEQREVGSDVPTFASGLRHVLRQDPDTILVGEMRDLETTRAAVTAAETGHLVLSTLHTTSAAQTVERVIGMYPETEQAQIRSMLASTLQAVISQTLIRRSDEAGMVAAVEVMICTPAVRSCIREGRVFEINNIIETNRAIGMQTLDYSLRCLFMDGRITRDDAMAHAKFPDKIDRQMVA